MFWWLLILLQALLASANVKRSDNLDKGMQACGMNGSCGNSTAFRDIQAHNCMCDEKCGLYGDCCLDSPFFDYSKQRRAKATYECISTFKDDEEDKTGYYMKTDCPASWLDANTRRKCKKGAENDQSDPLLITPVTAVRSGMVYANVFCAMCNGEGNVRHWSVGLQCLDLPRQLTNEEEMRRTLRFNATSQFWTVSIAEKPFLCSLHSQPPSIDDLLIQEPRLCVRTTSTCPAKSDQDIATRCEAYTYVMYAEDKPHTAYANAYCAMCNGVTKTLCQYEALSKSARARPVSFAIVFDFTIVSGVGRAQPCKYNQLYDPFLKMCRDIREDEERTVAAASQPPDCHKIVKVYDYVIEGATSGGGDTGGVLRVWGKSYANYVVDNGVALICVYDRFDGLLGFMTLVGMTTSILCLCLHLVFFSLVKELRNLSGKNLASFCVALLMAYVGFLAGNFARGGACYADALFTYYSLLATFAWMCAISFDVWRMLRVATKELRVQTGRQWKKFLVYSLCCWLIPAKLVIAAVCAQLLPPHLLPRTFAPDFGVGDVCWFGNGAATLAFFGVPTAIVMIVNACFFVNSFYMIYSSQSMARYSTSAKDRKNFRMYARLAVLTGLTWITGIAAGFVDINALWTLFVGLNTMTGAFVFLGFSCRSNVWRALKKLKRDKTANSAAHLPTFTWSTANEDGKCNGNAKSETGSTNTAYVDY